MSYCSKTCLVMIPLMLAGACPDNTLKQLSAAAPVKPDCLLAIRKIDVSPAEGGDGLVRALELARKIHRADARRMVRIQLVPGEYPLDRPVEFGPDDGNLVIAGEGAVLQCGRRLGRFTARPDGLWEAPAPKGASFRDLYVNGMRAARASEPNRHFLYMKNEAQEIRSGFYAYEKDMAFLRQVPKDELGDVVLRIYQSWDMGYSSIDEVDFETGHVRFKTGMMFKLFSFGTRAPRYAIENCRAALDAPGEWFLDRKVGRVLYVPRAGESFDTATACWPLVGCAIRMRGAKNVVLEGIGVENVAWEMSKDGITNIQAAYNVAASAIDVQECEGIVIRNCRVAHTGAHGIRIRENSRGCLIEHSLIEDLGAGGVMLGDEAWKPRGYQKLEIVSKKPHCERLHVRDSIIRHGGRVLEAGVGVLIAQASGCEVVHNDIYDFRYTGVSAGWTWGYAPTPVRDNHIDFNRIHHIGQGRLSDMAGVYTLGDSRGSSVNGNWIWEVNGYQGGGSPAWGLYTDEGTRGVLFSSNLVERCRSGAIHQHFGKDNLFLNNILTGFDEFAVWRSRSEPHVTIELRNNIFFWTNPRAKALTGRGGVDELTNIVAEANVWCPPGGTMPKGAFNGADWETWRKLGHDAKGVVADPMFADAGRRDWRLKPESPALKLGFRAFDWTEAGVLKADAAWRAKAEERTWDEFEDAPVPPLVAVTAGRCSFENCMAGKSAIASMNNFLVPFNPESSHGKSLIVTDQDPAEGRKCVVFKELQGLAQPWFPIINCRLRLENCCVLVRFSVKPLAGDYLLQVEPRDYGTLPGGRYVMGPTLRITDGAICDGGRRLAPAPVGKWTDVKLHVDLVNRTWSMESQTRGGEAGAANGRLARDFRAFTYLGLISYGKPGAEVAVDDVEFRREK